MNKPLQVAVRTFGDQISFHPHLDDAQLSEIFAREVLKLLVDRGLLSPEWAERPPADSQVGSISRCRHPPGAAIPSLS